jgi:HlyD family secretion protein
VKRVVPILIAGALIAGTAAVAVRVHRGAGEEAAADRKIVPVLFGDLEVTVEEDGELKALKTISVGTQVGGTITYLAPEGSRVKKGDILIELDTETVEQRIREAQADLESAEKKLADTRDRISAEAARLDLAVERAKTALELAELSLKELEGLPKAEDLNLAERALEEARLNCAVAERDRDQTAALAVKGHASPYEVEEKRLIAEKARAVLKREEVRYSRVKRGAAPTALEKARLKVEAARLELKQAESGRNSSLAALKQQLSWEEASLESLKRDRIEKLQWEFANHKVTAPADGTVIYCRSHRTDEKFAVGNDVRPGIAVVELPDTTAMMIRTFVPESAIGQVHLAKEARVHVDTIPGEEFPAKITWIDHWARDANQELSEADKKQEGLAGHQVFDIEAEITRRDERLKPGLKARIVIPVGMLTEVTYVEKGAVRLDGKNAYVLMKSGEKREVTVGEKAGPYIVVRKGLSAGEEVVVAR